MDFDGWSAADRFQRHAYTARRYLLIGSLAALALGIGLGAINVWNQHEQLRNFGNGPSIRFYILNFFGSLGVYALIAAVLLSAALLVASLAWFQAALSEDFDDLYDATQVDDDPGAGQPPPSPSDSQRPPGAVTGAE